MTIDREKSRDAGNIFDKMGTEGVRMYRKFCEMREILYDNLKKCENTCNISQICGNYMKLVTIEKGFLGHLIKLGIEPETNDDTDDRRIIEEFMNKGGFP